MMRIPTFFEFANQADTISQQMNSMAALYQQASSNQKIQHGSEDPVLASQIYANQHYINTIQSYDTNGTLAQTRSDRVSSVMTNVIAAVNDAQSVLSKINGGTLTADQIKASVPQLQGDLTTLLNLANSQDAGGNYLFSGFSTNTQPFVNVGGTYQYQGGMTPMTLELAPNVSATYYDSGFNIFSNIFSGNGTFTIDAASGNTGAASTDVGIVSDQASYVSDTYTVSFTQNGQGQTLYQVNGATSGAVVPPTLYTGETNINFNGISFNMKGMPNVGDTFTVQPSTQQNVFNTLQNLVNACQNAAPGLGTFKQALSQAQASFAQVSNHLISYQTQQGSSAQLIDNQVKANKSTVLNYQTTLSSLADADLTQVFSALMQQSIALQATQASYLKLQDTLMAILKV